MRIEVVCSDPAHPVWPRLQSWADAVRERHDVSIVSRSGELQGGDLLFLVSCSEFIGSRIRDRYRAALVLHASDLPEGRGWSPHIWQILEGRSELCVSLIDAADAIDTGAIWAQERIQLEGHELHDEINASIFDAELRLMSHAVEGLGRLTARPQPERPGSYYRRRVPEDGRLDPQRSFAEQFDLMRVSDPDRYPAFFVFRGHRYVVRLTKATEQ